VRQKRRQLRATSAQAITSNPHAPCPLYSRCEQSRPNPGSEVEEPSPQVIKSS